MSEERANLSRRSVEVLRLISRGNTYEQILSIHPEMTYLDIFRSAEEALNIAALENAGHSESQPAVRADHPRAYENWSPSEDAELARLTAMGESVEEMAQRLRRQPSAIRSRMMRFNLSENDISG